MFITPEPESTGIHTIKPTWRSQILHTFQRWNRTRDAAASLNSIHHIDAQTGVEDYDKATRDMETSLATVLDPEALEILTDIAEETKVPAVVWINVAVRKLVDRHLPSHGTPGVIRPG